MLLMQQSKVYQCQHAPALAQVEALQTLQQEQLNLEPSPGSYQAQAPPHVLFARPRALVTCLSPVSAWLRDFLACVQAVTFPH